MKAVVFHGVHDIRLDTVPDPTIATATATVPATATTATAFPRGYKNFGHKFW